MEWWDDEDERVILSKEKAANIKVWENIKKCYDEDGTIRGTITSRVKGGFSVDIGVLAFLPGSQVDIRPIRNLEKLIGGAALYGYALSFRATSWLSKVSMMSPSFTSLYFSMPMPHS